MRTKGSHSFKPVFARWNRELSPRSTCRTFSGGSPHSLGDVKRPPRAVVPTVPGGGAGRAPSPGNCRPDLATSAKTGTALFGRHVAQLQAINGSEQGGADCIQRAMSGDSDLRLGSRRQHFRGRPPRSVWTRQTAVGQVSPVDGSDPQSIDGGGLPGMERALVNCSQPQSRPPALPQILQVPVGPRSGLDRKMTGPNASCRTLSTGGPLRLHGRGD
jgi:hypothetical protein